VRVLELYLLQNPQEQVNEWLGGQEQENGVKFQQHNSSKKIDDQMRRVGVSFIPKKAKRGAFDGCQVLAIKRERNF
jgi:hypothetical protein